MYGTRDILFLVLAVICSLLVVHIPMRCFGSAPMRCFGSADLQVAPTVAARTRKTVVPILQIIGSMLQVTPKTS